jgi:hypothetical protein
MRRTLTHLIATTYFLLLLLLASKSIGTPSYASQPVKVADADKAEILRSVLRREIGKTKRAEVETILLLIGSVRGQVAIFGVEL